MVKLTKVQADTMSELLQNFVIYENRKFGKISNILLMTNKFFQGSVIVRFEQTSSMSVDEKYDLELVEIKPDGTMEKLNDKFKNVFERYAFLGECVAFSQSEIVVED